MLVSIRALELEFNRPIGVLQDPQGPKIRNGRLDEGKLALDAGETVCFALRDRREAVIPRPHPEIFAAAYPGQALLIDDGRSSS
ncbi:pyruvate kinase [Bradyrhizobium diazoefficiens]